MSSTDSNPSSGLDPKLIGRKPIFMISGQYSAVKYHFVFGDRFRVIQSIDPKDWAKRAVGFVRFLQISFRTKFLRIYREKRIKILAKLKFSFALSELWLIVNTRHIWRLGETMRNKSEFPGLGDRRTHYRLAAKSFPEHKQRLTDEICVYLMAISADTQSINSFVCLTNYSFPSSAQLFASKMFSNLFFIQLKSFSNFIIVFVCHNWWPNVVRSDCLTETFA